MTKTRGSTCTCCPDRQSVAQQVRDPGLVRHGGVHAERDRGAHLGRAPSDRSPFAVCGAGPDRVPLRARSLRFAGGTGVPRTHGASTQRWRRLLAEWRQEGLHDLMPAELRPGMTSSSHPAENNRAVRRTHCDGFTSDLDRLGLRRRRVHDLYTRLPWSASARRSRTCASPGAKHCLLSCRKWPDLHPAHRIACYSLATALRCLVGSAGEKKAGRTGLEPAASGVTGRRYNQLNYRPRNLSVVRLRGRSRDRTCDHRLVRATLYR